MNFLTMSCKILCLLLALCLLTACTPESVEPTTLPPVTGGGQTEPTASSEQIIPTEPAQTTPTPGQDGIELPDDTLG